MPDVRQQESPSPPRRDRQERRRARNRTALLEAAREVVRAKGAEAATMQDITDRADVGTGTIYNYFESKNDLLRAVFEDELLSLARSVQSIADEMQDPVRAAACGYWLSLSGVASNPLWKHLMQRPELVAQSMYKTHRTLSLSHITEIRRRFSEAPVSDEELETTWWQGVGTLFSLANAVQEGRLVCDESFLRTATENLLRMLGVPDAEIRTAVAEPPAPLPQS